MKTRLFTYLCILFAGMMLYSCGSDDVEIKKKVEMEVQKEYAGITANSLNGIVTLTGTVDSEEAKTKAGEIAKGVKYVRSVTNNIYVKEPEPVVVETPDEVLAKAVNAALKAAGFDAVSAAVKDSVVTLSGDVKKADVVKIMQIASYVKPKKIDNQLKSK